MAQFLKIKILRLRVNNDMNQNHNEIMPGSAQYVLLFNKKLEQRKKNDRVGIPSPGDTREWNFIYKLMEFVLNNQLFIRQLLSICFFFLNFTNRVNVVFLFFLILVHVVCFFFLICL